MALALAVAGPAAAKKGGNGGGGGHGGGGGGGGGDTGGESTPIKITFADELGSLGYRISGDEFGPYEHDPDGSGVEAYLGGGGALGDIFLRLANAAGRGLWLDFSSCRPGTSCADPGPVSGLNLVSSISVAPGDVVASGDGLFGIPPGETIDAPMDMYFDFDDPDGPGFIYFNSGLKGRNPCKNKSLNVSVTRLTAAEAEAQGLTDPAWIVSADETSQACVRLPGGGQLAGQYLMPFAFAVELAP